MTWTKDQIAREWLSLPAPAGGAQAAAACTRDIKDARRLASPRENILPRPKALCSFPCQVCKGQAGATRRGQRPPLQAFPLPKTPPAPLGSRRRPPPAPEHTYDAASIALQRSTLPRSSSVQPPVPCNAHRFRLRALVDGAHQDTGHRAKIKVKSTVKIRAKGNHSTII